MGKMNHVVTIHFENGNVLEIVGDKIGVNPMSGDIMIEREVRNEEEGTVMHSRTTIPAHNVLYYTCDCTHDLREAKAIEAQLSEIRDESGLSERLHAMLHAEEEERE